MTILFGGSLSTTAWITLTLFAVFIGYRAFLRERKFSGKLTAQDIMFSKSAIQEGICTLGYSVSSGATSPALAIQIGYEAAKTGGVKYVVAISIIALGVAENYLRNKNKGEAGIAKLFDNINNLAATEFDVDPSKLWDLRGATIGENNNAGFIFQKACEKGFRISNEANESDIFKRIVVAVAEGDTGICV